jgi:fatty acid desaturase
MHVSLKQIQVLTTFDKYNLLLSLYIYIYILIYVSKEINLLFFKCVQMFRHKSKGKGRKGDSSGDSPACSNTSADLFAVMVLLKFFYISSFIITLLLHLIFFLFLFTGHFGRPTPTGGIA